MIDVLISIIQLLSRLIFLFVIVNVFMSYFLPPYHNVRATCDRILDPFLNPIRRLMPNIGGLDFSPLVLIVLVQIIESLLIGTLSTLR